MDWASLVVSLKLGILTLLILLPVGIWLGRVLAWRSFRGRGLVLALVLLPLVLPPTVLGYYLLVALGKASPLGVFYEALVGRPLVFTFEGLLIASVIVNIPFAVQPMLRAFEAIPREVLDAAACSGLRPLQVLRRIELPLAWPGIVTGMVLTFAHTLGEFGVVLMVGGSIPGETRTASIAIYDRLQAFDEFGAGAMAAVLLALSVVTLGITQTLEPRFRRPGR